MSDSREHIDMLWQRALKESIMAGEEFTRYRFAALIEAEAARRCAQVAGPEDSYQDEYFKAKADSVARIRAEFPEAWMGVKAK